MAQAIPDRWRDPAVGLELRAWEVDPRNPDVVRGEIGHLIPGSCKVTYGRDADTRVSATVSVHGLSMADGSRVRLTVDADGGGREELGTFFVGRVEGPTIGGVTTLTLQSQLWGLSEDRTGYRWVIGKGVRARAALQRVLDVSYMRGTFLPGFRDSECGKTVTYEVSDSLLAIVSDECSASGNRYDVNGHGLITFGPADPSFPSADWEVDERDARTVVLKSDYADTYSAPTAYSRSIVEYRGNGDEHKTGKGGNELKSYEQVEIVGQANVPASSPLAPGRRGYTRAKVHSVSELSPKTQARAEQLAREMLREDSRRSREVKKAVMWCPISVGHVVSWTDMQGVRSLLRVRTAECDLGRWVKSLTMDEV
nr:hypothetical protein [uncultured Olsenella sp.]